mmetsp:Transcript_16160/g.40880  ORF Transcript_16160/g.40880 Transcript_16160/m.40880 type:complete len:81 (+) Transcript_16160:682-924(+)
MHDWMGGERLEVNQPKVRIAANERENEEKRWDTKVTKREGTMHYSLHLLIPFLLFHYTYMISEERQVHDQEESNPDKMAE